MHVGIKTFKKTKTEHTILPEFVSFLQEIEKHPGIHRIIPGRINRQQKGSSKQYIHLSYPTPSGLKYKISKGGTSQELFVICDGSQKEEVKNRIEKCKKKFTN